MSGEGRAVESIRPELEQLRLGLFAVALSLLLAAILFLMRPGLPNPPLAILLGPAIVALAVLPALLWGSAIWAGPLAVIGLIVACLLAAGGIVGFALLWIGTVASVVVAIRRLREEAFLSPRRAAAWAALLIGAALLAALLTLGSKYVNFLADQLLLYGRADNDVMFHGAIINAFRYFHFPSTGIDGLNLLRYHTGVDALAALVSFGGNVTAVFGLMILKIEVLLPLALFALAWGGLLFAQALLPVAPRALAAAVAAAILLLLAQCGSMTQLIVLNDPMLLSGILLALLAPPIVMDLLARREAARPALIAATLAIPALTLAKVSTGAIWCALIGWLVLRLVGPKRPVFWITALAMTAVFAGSFWMANTPGQTGAVLFGTPFYVEYGFGRGNFLLPLAMHATLLIVIGAFLLLRDAVPAQPRRMLIEAYAMTAIAANLPALLLYIPGGDAVFFLSALNWMVAPWVVMVAASLPVLIPEMTPKFRRFAWPVAGLVLVGLAVDAGIRVDDKLQVATAATALIRTGDTSYYADDKRRAWRADTRRALAEHGLIELYTMKPASPSGASLLSALETAKSADAAVYFPPDSDYWQRFAVNCDAKSLWPMAAVGVPLIDGYVPVQAECPQEFAPIGYGPPPAVRARLDDAALCRRAEEAGLPVVMEIESLEDRSKDRVAACRS
jgi:hypothetical protein